MTITVEQANLRLDSIHTEQELRDLINQLDTNTHGTTTVLYSGSFNGKLGSESVHTTEVIGQLKSNDNLRILDNTEAFKFSGAYTDEATGQVGNQKLYDKIVEIFGDSPDIRGSKANQFLFGSMDVDGDRVADGAFDIICTSSNLI